MATSAGVAGRKGGGHMTGQIAGWVLASVLVINILTKRKHHRSANANVLDTFAALVDKAITRSILRWLARIARSS